MDCFLTNFNSFASSFAFSLHPLDRIHLRSLDNKRHVGFKIIKVTLEFIVARQQFGSWNKSTMEHNSKCSYNMENKQWTLKWLDPSMGFVIVLKGKDWYFAVFFWMLFWMYVLPRVLCQDQRFNAAEMCFPNPLSWINSTVDELMYN